MFEKLSIGSLTTTMTGGAYRLWDTAKGYFIAESGQDDEKTSASLLSAEQQNKSWSIPHPKKLLMLASLGLAYYTHQAGYHHNCDNQGAGISCAINGMDISYVIDGMDFTFSVPFQTTSDWSFAIPSSTQMFTQFAMLYGTSSLLSQSYQYNQGNLLIAPLSLMTLFNFLPTLPAQTIETEFFKVFGGNLVDSANAVKTTSSGDIVVAGYTTSFGAGDADILVAKFNVNGSLVWTRTLGGNSTDIGTGLALATTTTTTTDDIAVVGYTDSFGAGDYDVLVAKLYANGSLAWARTLGGTNHDYGNGILFTATDDIFVSSSTLSFGGVGGYYALITKLYANGSLAWAHALGGSGENGNAITTTITGEIVVTGLTDGADVLVTKLYANGSLAWARALGGNGYDEGYAITLTDTGDIVVTGRTQSFGTGSGDVLIIKLDANGNLLWARTLGGNSSDSGYALALTPNDDIVIAGQTNSFGAGSSDTLIAKLYTNGSLAWAHTLGGNNTDSARALALTDVGGIVVVENTNSFGAGSVDVLLAKLNANSTINGCNLTRSIQPTLLSWSSISNNVIIPTFTSLNTTGLLRDWVNISTQFITPQSLNLLNLCLAENVLTSSQSTPATSTFMTSSPSTLNISSSTQTSTPTPTSMVTPSSVFAPMPAPAPVAPSNLPPILQTNTLSLTTGSTVTLSSLNFYATDDQTLPQNLIFIVSQVSNGHFQTSTDTTPIYSFTQQQLQNREILFVHDGSNNPPSYQVHVNDGSLNSLPQWAAITFNNNAIPVLVNNQITISTGQTVILNNVNLNATDADINNADNLVFTVSDIQHGFFANTTNPNVPITTFTQGDINAGIIQFTHDGSNNYPSYYVSVSDGTFNTPPSLVNINFNNNFIPIILNNQFILIPGQNTIIGIENIGGLDLNGNSNALIFTVSNLSGGQFELVNNPGVGILQFTQQDIIDGNVLFMPDALDCINPTSPSYNLQASDGSYSTLFNIASIDSNTYTTTHGCVITTSSEQDNTALYAGVGVSAVVAVGATLTVLGIFAVKQRHQREKTAERINEMDEMAQYAAQYKNQPHIENTEVLTEEGTFSEKTNYMSY